MDKHEDGPKLYATLQTSCNKGRPRAFLGRALAS